MPVIVDHEQVIPGWLECRRGGRARIRSELGPLLLQLIGEPDLDRAVLGTGRRKLSAAGIERQRGDRLGVSQQRWCQTPARAGIPHLDGSDFSEREPLFQVHRSGTSISRTTTQLGMLLSGGTDGGLFIMIGRKR